MIDYGRGIVGFILTLISLIHGSAAWVISFMVVVIIIRYQYNNRLKREEKITLLLSTNIYLLIFLYITALISCNIQTIVGDIHGNNFDSSWCVFVGYYIVATCCALYHAFVTQALFRLGRIVYSNYRWLQHFWFYIIVTGIQVVGAFALLSPVLIWHDVIYLSNDHYCCVSFKIILGVLWAVFACYGLPLIYLSLIYIRITLFIRQQSNTVALAIKRRQQRDLLAIQRILINVGLLIAIGFPAMVLLVMLFITGEEHPLLYRILWIGAEVSMAVLSIAMVLTTPQLKNIVMKRQRQNRVTTIEGPVRMGSMSTAH
ncbi:unnamed protein product [Rotaria sordida]|uniref:G-protein coupled receptors family 1 profile domain-containing protein n=1 Tax=Rotaria sordida TaxID=392033 RepID=A0A819PUN4_9BILA|nr:unnamed protein product [Rotaria sordida]CAF4101230.1 unnamed protein product [Rotaria sordida]